MKGKTSPTKLKTKKLLPHFHFFFRGAEPAAEKPPGCFLVPQKISHLISCFGHGGHESPTPAQLNSYPPSPQLLAHSSVSARGPVLVSLLLASRVIAVRRALVPHRGLI